MLPDLLETLLRERQAFLPDGSRAPLHSNVSRDEALVLHRAARAARPEVSVEIGFAQGISGLAILQALEENARGVHHAIDPFQDRYQNSGLEHARRAGLAHRLQFHRSFAEEVLPALPRLQFAFIDSSHLFDLTLAEFVLADKKLETGGLIGFHDLWMPSLQSALRFILANRSYEIVREFDAPAPPREISPLENLKRAFRGALRALPAAHRIFRRDLLQPWPDFRAPNLVLLRKTGHDARDWKFHADF